MSELVERLKYNAEMFIVASVERRLLTEAADRITALEAENARLKEALKPFANLRRVFAGKTPDDAPHMPDSHAYNLVWNMDNGKCDLTLGQFRRARAALGGSHA